MKPNAYIIYERMRVKYPVKMYGNANPKMTLCPPELYMDNTLRFYAGHVYLATAEHLPQRPVIEKNVVLICIGDNTRLSYYKEHAAVIQIKKKVDFFKVFTELQSIYQLFYDWESRLLELFMGSPTIQDLLICSYPVFECPVFVLDTAFQYVASVCPSEKKHRNKGWNQSQGNLNTDVFLEFLSKKELSMDTRGAFILEFEEGNVLCVNLFNSGDDYIGCLCIDQAEHTYIKGEERIAEHLAQMIEKVSETIPVLLKSERSSLAEILQIIMKEMPLSQNQKLFIKSRNYKREYICLSLHCLKRSTSLPVSYICSVLKSLLLDSIFFEQNNTILGLIPMDVFHERSCIADELEVRMSSLIEEMQLCIGVSNAFTDLYKLRTYYFQAEAAIENGLLYKEGKKIYQFCEFALQEMVINSFGGFPVEAYFPDGFHKLLKHDKDGEISYLETLAVYLEENMSYAKAARRLYIHRSTLIERMARITQELTLDLDDPDQRLQLSIILKALDIEEQIKKEE